VRGEGNHWVDFNSTRGSPDVYAIKPSYLANDEFPNRADMGLDADVDIADHSLFVQCVAGPDAWDPPTGCSPTEMLLADLDGQPLLRCLPAGLAGARAVAAGSAINWSR
jgi:hypothetical protein